ncbi:MAG: phosphotransferase [Bacteroidia bacterium]|nr:phosphotransferase [Bacteroidia bacterium]MCZ2278288.1 phosphotransferase [Bacteroidia bacterium]
MSQLIDRYYTPAVLSEITKRYGTDLHNLKLLRKNVNIIYSFRQGFKSFILRITHSSEQTKEVLLSEIDWLSYLHQHGADVSTPVESLNHNLIEVVESGDTYFTVVKFSKAPGHKLDQFHWDKPVFKEIGRVTGRLHRLTKQYVPGKGVIPRQDLLEIEVKKVLVHADNHSAEFISEMLRLVGKLEQLPKTKNDYGLIHNDINRGNMFIHKGRICLFDTADCAYSWFVSDIALTLFYAVLYFDVRPEGRHAAYIRFFMNHFWEGYLQENQLPAADLHAISDLMTLRAIFLCDYIKSIYSGKQLNQAEKKFYEQLMTFSYEGFGFLGFEFICP